MKTIYNTYIVLKSKNQLDRLLKYCSENGLEVNLNNEFKKGDCFRKGIGFGFSNWHNSSLLTDGGEITEQEFIELLKATKL